MKKRYAVVFFVIIFGLLFWLLFKYATAPMVTGPASPATLAPESAPAQKDDLIIVDTPLPQSKIGSPLVVKGKARGGWYFEASFPVRLVDSVGNVLVEAPATAQGDWMTANYVPFAVTLNYAPQPAGSTGYLILQKDNASGEPQFDNSLSIPITF